MARKATRGEQTKGETITVRLSPKMKFGLELLARKQHRTISGVVEWAIARALESDELGQAKTETTASQSIKGPDGEGVPFTITYMPLLERLWAPHESERILNLSKHAPNLLSFEEEVILRILRTAVAYITEEKADYTIGFLGGDEPQPRLISKLWDKIKACAAGDITEDDLENALSLAYLKGEGGSHDA